MSAKEMNTEAQTTAHHWGYRELDAFELQFVGGGDDGGDGADGDSGSESNGGYGGHAGDGQGGEIGSTSDSSTTDASLGCNLVGFGVTLGLSSRGVSPAAAGIAGLLAQQACENLTASNGTADSLSAAWGGYREDNTR